MSLIRQNRGATAFQQRHFFLRRFLRQWRLQQLKSQKIASHQLQMLERFIFCFKCF